MVSHVSDEPDYQGIAAYKQRIVDARRAFPDFHVTVDEIIGERDTIVHRWTYQVTFTGPSSHLPAPPTGRRATVQGTWVGHFAAGKLVEDWYTYDMFGLMQQLGLVPKRQVAGSPG